MTAIRPTREVAPFVALIGEAATLRLLEAYAGLRIEVPRRAGPKTLLTGVVGVEAARKLAAAFGGQRLYVPLAKRWRIQHLRARGLTYGEIARQLGVSEGTVFHALADAGMTRQMALPF